MEFKAKSKSEIFNYLDGFNPALYAESRNYIDGQLSFLSPYISRGVISTQEVASYLSKKNWTKNQLLKFIQELAWRDYFQIVYAFNSNSKKENNQPIEVPEIIVNAQSGIQGIDEGVEKLYQTGYMHNHQRMYVAMLVCNILKLNFENSARWLYYHLLDADEASNSLSWKWVAGELTGKKYFANQENINHYCRTNQYKTFLDVSYDTLPNISLNEKISRLKPIILETKLPETSAQINFEAANILLFNAYNLDATWHNDFNAERILLLEPSHFFKFPISPKTIDFIIAQAKLLPDVKIFVGEFSALKNLFRSKNYFFKSHPLFSHYEGNSEPAKRIFDEVKDYYPSFSAYWKKCLKYL